MKDAKTHLHAHVLIYPIQSTYHAYDPSYINSMSRLFQQLERKNNEAFKVS